MPQLNFATYPAQFLWLFVAFLLQYLLVAKVIIPAFRKLYQTRQNHIDIEIQKAEKLIKHSERLRKNYETELKNAKEAHAHLMEATLSSLKKDMDMKLREIEEQLSLDSKEQEKQLAELKEFAQKEIQNTAVQSALLVINKLTNKKVKPTQLSKYLN